MQKQVWGKPSELLKVEFSFKSKIADVSISKQGQLDFTQKAAFYNEVMS